MAVVGGGIAGLAAAWELTGGASGPASDTPSVIVFEAEGRLGGKIRSDAFAGLSVDTGPDAFLGRRPEAAALCAEIGLGDELVAIAASGAAVWSRGRPRALPDGVIFGVPTRLWPLARSGILGLGGTLRASLDVVLPRPPARGPIGDRAIGPLIAHKLGRSVVDALVDPLVGGIHAGGVADMSTAAVNPLLLAVAQRRASFMKSLRHAVAREVPGAPRNNHDAGDPPDAFEDHPTEATPTEDDDRGESPLFWALRGGLGSLVDRLERQLVARSVTIRTHCPIEALRSEETDGAPWVLESPDGPVPVDGIVLALPAGPAAVLLDPHDTDATTLLGGIEYASVAIVTLAYPESSAARALTGTGMLVPRGCPPPAGVAVSGPLMVTACSYLSNKWPHLAREGEVLVRASVGHIDDERFITLSDEELTSRVVAELSVLVGLGGEPTASAVTRWPDSFPQYRVHHLLRVTGIEAAVKRLPALAVAGAAYRGLGIPACIASGRTAAHAVLDALAGTPDTAAPGP